MKVDLYIPEVVRQLQAFYGSLLLDFEQQSSTRAYLFALARKLGDGLREGKVCLYSEINNHHPDYLGVPVDQLKDKDWDLDACKLIVARQYGFADWKEVHTLDESQPLSFERVVQALINGNQNALLELLDQHPDLVEARSPYGHRATLLHYAGSNGVEMWRQQVPANLPQLVRLLVERGANLGATMRVYGGEFTTLELAKTSAHPYDAGIADKLFEALA